jgi:hypothetical protein
MNFEGGNKDVREQKDSHEAIEETGGGMWGGWDLRVRVRYC